MKAWGLVPARGGSKSIPRKNLVSVAGRPLLDYGVIAARASGRLDRIFCSTDDQAIARRAEQLGIEVAWRPAELATDAAKVDRVVEAFLKEIAVETLPDVVVLIQPTSPFLLPAHIADLLDELSRRTDIASIHNATRVSHNQHAWNHRSIGTDGRVDFPFAEQRKGARNKQEKPVLFAFGNLIAARTDALLAGRGFYAEPAGALEIAARWGFDLDGPDDLELAEALLASGYIRLPHLAAAIETTGMKV